MALHEPQTLSIYLKELKLSLDSWRERGETPRVIPDAIWEQAVVAAEKFGVGPVSKSLRLDHAKLKSKLAQKSSTAHSVAPLQESGLPSFFEFLPHAETQKRLERCVFEVESNRGGRVRLEVSGLEFPGLVTLIREFVA